MEGREIFDFGIEERIRQSEKTQIANLKSKIANSGDT